MLRARYDYNIESYVSQIENTANGANPKKIKEIQEKNKIAQRELNSAEKYYTKAIEMNQQCANAYYGLGLIAEIKLADAEAQYAFALIQKEQALTQINPTNAKEANAKMQKHDASVQTYLMAIKEHYNKATEMEPLSGKFYLKWGQFEQKKGNITNAVKCYRKNLSLTIRFVPDNNTDDTFDEVYSLFYHFAESIVALHQKCLIEISRIQMGLISKARAAMSNDEHLLWKLVQDIYKEAVKYSVSPLGDAHFKLLFIDIILDNYEQALKKVQDLLEQILLLNEQEIRLPKTACSQRELFYICGMLYDLQNNNSQAEVYYRKAIHAGNSENFYADDTDESWVQNIKKSSLSACLALKRNNTVASKIIGTKNVFSEILAATKPSTDKTSMNSSCNAKHP